MPSFDIVSEVEMPEVKNAVENTNRELSTRFDFRNVTAEVTLNEKNEVITVSSESDFQVRQIVDILREKMLKRGIEGAVLDVPEEITHSGKSWSLDIKMKKGIESDIAKKIVKVIKDAKLKVQTQIQGESLRVTGKSRDDLQSSMATVKAANLGQPFQFKNFRD
ncbi:YajQ family cyclic di-GMP-binding protein [Rosenbergiella epipactidis]|uniref:YajQ family cyclic di-GMP-binding protein n=1 Tax=Erwiniaceae TaxID=1903409 RepID=UPI000C1950D0|nr:MULTISPECIES: YajQ family cyclic di-GMP-binding protein [Erwiniaceae]MBT0719038.1 YajQ family cyclic di-GMP-binding protein [Rosenbergiella epipactidis]MCL9667243.1 YajQ family cyclic di-GMP-binding protein [Rosenbergiella epipactidis]PIJ40622.1 YajQ family cyclic di-GMP-binding protein [Tatumella sp. OPLPL6]